MISSVKTVRCRASEKAIGGGTNVSGAGLSVTLSAPTADVGGWSAQVSNLSDTNVSGKLSVYVYCR